MDEKLIKNIAESLMSNEVNAEYLHMYLNNQELRKKCDKVISEYIENDISTSLIGDKCLNYLNNVVKLQLKKKPYLSNLNIILITIEEYIDKISNEFKSDSSFDKKIFDRNIDRARNLINKIDNDFIFENVDLEAEERLANIYINRMKNNNSLSKEQVEELLSFTIIGGFLLKHEEYTDKAFDYALKTILNNDYKIDSYLYKNLFLYACNNILKERNIEDVNIVFDDYVNVMSYSNSSKTIFINYEKFLSNDLFKNFIGFFHELRHYEQYNGLVKEPLKRFLCYKDMFLSDRLPYKEYYKKNYNNLFIEKDACYTSYEYAYNFINEKAPSKLHKLKKEIYEDLWLTIALENKNINERKYNGNIKDINVLFEEMIRKDKMSKNRFELLDFCNGFVNTPLLIEYDIFGNKRSVFELLASKEYNEEKGNNEIVEINNYLLYEESVTIDYIIENTKLFDSKKNKELYGKYYKEARKVLKHKLLKYKADLLSNKRNKLSENKYITSAFYESVIDKLRKKNIKSLNMSKNIELYHEREEELRIAYKWLYAFSKEIEEEKRKEILQEIDHKSR